MPAQKRTTLREIAEKTGYHFTTVSLALRGHHSIPEKTRDKIRIIAESMGYKPDPILSALVAYRHSKTQTTYAGTLVWLLNYEPDYKWEQIPLFKQYFEGAQKEAKTLGYQIETLNLRSEGMTAKRASDILKTRGIPGIFIPPQQKAYSTLDLDWDHFSVISFGYTLEKPQFHVISNNHFRMMYQLLEELYKLGYRKPGLVMLKKSAQRVEFKWISAYLGKNYDTPDFTNMEPLIMQDWDKKAFLSWYEKNQPDVIISGRRQIPELLPTLEEMGLRLPEDIGYADHNMSDTNTETAGIKQNGILVGKTALAQLVGMIHRNEKGIPDTPTDILVDGHWFQGPTVRSIK